MNPVTLLLAIVESIIGVGSFVYLMMNCVGACTPMISVLCAVGFMVFSVLACASWKKAIVRNGQN